MPTEIVVNTTEEKLAIVSIPKESSRRVNLIFFVASINLAIGAIFALGASVITARWIVYSLLDLSPTTVSTIYLAVVIAISLFAFGCFLLLKLADYYDQHTSEIARAFGWDGKTNYVFKFED